jgi:hypothetical protein
MSAEDSGPRHPLLKPSQLEGLEKMTPRERRRARTKLFYLQNGICACGCKRPMRLVQGFWDSVSLEHKKPQPAGMHKDDSWSNLSATRWDCNFRKGSRRNFDGAREGQVQKE